MNNNGRTFVNFITPGQATATAAPWQVSLTHYTCGNKKMCVNSSEDLPAVSSVDAQIISGPTLIPNSGQYCCAVRIICAVVYNQVCGNPCCPNYCLQDEKVAATVCVPCSEALPTVEDVGASVSAVNLRCGCSTTNQMELNVAFTLNTTT